jgi:hypothetical protein
MTNINLDGSIHNRLQNLIGQLWAITRDPQDVADVSCLRNLLLALVRKILYEERHQCRSEGGYKRQEML